MLISEHIILPKKQMQENFFSYFADDKITGRVMGHNFEQNLHKNHFHLYCDASTLDRNQYEQPIAMDRPNSIIAGIIKYKDVDYVCYKKNILCEDNNMAELLAIQEGLHLASSLKVKNLNIYTDSCVSITFIKKHFQEHKTYLKNTKFIPITEDILTSLKNFESCNFVHVPRKQNKQADKLTKFRRSLLTKS